MTSWVTMSRGFRSHSTSFMIWAPAWRASSSRAGVSARIVPLPGRASPNTSEMLFIELAVNRPEQEPQPGQP